MKQLTTLVAAALMLLSFPSMGQVKHAFIETRMDILGNYNSQTHFTAGFDPSTVNIVVDGDITPSLSFYLRQRLNKKWYDENIPLNATDQLWLKWDFAPRFSVQGGKIPLVVGSFEFDEAPIDLYYWGAFATNFPDVYALGGNFIFKASPENTLFLQFTQSPLSFVTTNCFAGAFVWDGQFTPWWKTLWSLNCMDDADHKPLGIIGLGNRFLFGNFKIDYDLMYRSGFEALATVFGNILKVEYSIPRWKFFAKGSYELNRNCTTDITFPETTYVLAGGGVEFFPWDDDKLRFHAVCHWNPQSKSVFGNIGITYRFGFIKKDSSINS